MGFGIFGDILCDRRGATAIEYGILSGGVAASVAAAVFALGGQVGGFLDGAGGAVSGRDIGRGKADMITILTQNFATDREGWTGMAPRRTLDQIGTGLSLARESRIGDGQEAVRRVFDIPAGASRAAISFDMSFVDSWDDETARIYVNGAEVMAGAHDWNTDTPPALVQMPTQTMTIDAQLTNSVQAGVWGNGIRGTDHTYRVTITVDDPGEALQLGFGTSLNQGQMDESLLIGNVELRVGS